MQKTCEEICIFKNACVAGAALWTKQNRSHGALVQLDDSQRVTESSCGRQQFFMRRKHLVVLLRADF